MVMEKASDEKSEAFPLSRHRPSNKGAGSSLKAPETNPPTPLYFYATWPQIDSGRQHSTIHAPAYVLQRTVA